MKSALFVIAAVVSAAGCDNSACRGVDGTCVALTVAGSGSVDGLEIVVSGAATGTKVVPQMAAVASLPVEVGLQLAHASTGTLHIDVVGVLLGDQVGAGSTDVPVTIGAHANATVTLSPDGGGLPGDDGGAGPPIDVAGTRVRHYVLGDGGVVDVPTDFTQAPIAAITDEAGTFTTTPATGDANGHFSVHASSSPYYLSYFASYLFGSASSPDLSTWILGRPDQTYPTLPTALSFNVTNAAAWNTSDTLQFFAFNAGTAVFSVEDALKPLANATTFSGALDLSRAVYGKLIDAAKGDDAMLLQLVADSSSGESYLRLGKIAHFPPFSIADGGAQTISASMVDVPKTLSLGISWSRSQFVQYASAVNPSATQDYDLFDVFAQPGGTAHGAFDSTPDLLVAYPTAGNSDLTLTLGYGNPFPSSWPLVAATGSNFAVSYTAPGASAGSFDGAIYSYAAVDSLPSPLVPLVSPVQGAQINGRTAYSTQSSVAATPLLAWSAPALGTPSSYGVYAYAIDNSLGATTLDFAGEIYTTLTSVRIPPGMLVGGQSYFFVITALSESGVDRSVTPFTGTLPSGWADTLSAAITVAAPATADGASCKAILTAHPGSPDGIYTVDGGATPFTTWCDMTTDGGGWTLVGKIDGRATMTSTWLRSAVNPWQLASPTITDGMYSCANAVPLAVGAATEIRLANSARTKWVKWPLPTGRTTTNWWNHAAGQATINAATQSPVVVKSSTGATGNCFQNVYGINPLNGHGGSYPATMQNAAGNTTAGDWCMGVGTLLMGASADGYTQNGNGFDAPTSEGGWPNNALNVPAHVSVWLR